MFRVLMICMSGLLLISAPTLAGDWPQILGPQRNGIADEENIAERWPKTGLETDWELSVGNGFAGVAVVGERVILFHRQDGNEVIEALNTTTGESVWSDRYPTSFYPQVGGGDGPLCVPTVVANHVITFGAQGVLSCTDLQTGQNLWRRKTHEDFNAREGYFGAGSAPLVLKDRVIVNVGGTRDDAGVVAFSLKTGETLWNKTSEPPSYSAPTIATVEGLPQILMVTRYKCMMLDPDKGALRFQFPFGSRGPTVNGATPIVDKNHLLVTSSYGVGTVYAKFDFFGFDKVWEDERLMASQYCTPILFQDFMYVVDGRDDRPPADLKCIDLRTQTVKWTQPDVGYGTLVLVDGKLIFTKTNGELVLIQPNPNAYMELSKDRPFRSTVRALPAVSNGRLFLRNEDTLKCLNLSK